MSLRNLDCLLAPRSVALIGASDRSATVGMTLLENMARGFTGPIMLVNPQHAAIAGRPCYPDIAALPETPELAVIATPAPTLPALIADLGRRGCKAVAVVSAGFGGSEGAQLKQAMLDAARPHLLRILGPSSVGLIVPKAGLNAGVAHLAPASGHIGFLAQSGAIATSVLDYAVARGIGFSHFVSMGEMADVDFADLLDWLAGDPNTSAVLLHIETVGDARRFMSAARVAARGKPVIVIKGGRHGESDGDVASHNSALADGDAVYDAAFRRAGLLRVYSLAELLDAAETLGSARPAEGDRLAILTNGGGIGILAADALIDEGGRLAELSARTLARLDAALPPIWSHGNPVDIAGDADAARYEAALDALLADPGADAVLVLNCPTAVVDGSETARAVLRAHKRRRRCLLTSWVGEATAGKARALFAAAGMPTYDTPESAVRGFMHLLRWRRSRAQLMETPPSIPESFRPDRDGARRIVAAALAEERNLLTGPESRAVVAAYGIPLSPPQTAHNPPAAVERGEGVELILGMREDARFGPVMLFGQGGVAVEQLGDRALGLPPLNLRLARDMIERTRVFRLLRGYRDRRAVDLDAVALALVKMSQLACDLAEIVEIDVNPLLARPDGIVARDARVVVTGEPRGIARLAIRPYPAELESDLAVDGVAYRLRPIRPEDEPALQRCFARLSPEAVRMRFFAPMKRLSHSLAAQLTQIDYDRDMAFVLADPGPAGPSEIHGVVRISADPDGERAEFAIVVVDALTGRGFGRLLMQRMLDYAAARGIGEIFGDTLAENSKMLDLCRRFGFEITPSLEQDGVYHARRAVLRP